MKEIYSRNVWVIMSSDMLYIAKGTPRNRHIVSVLNEKDNKRVLTYTTKAKAESAFTDFGFFGGKDLELIAVECKSSLIKVG